MCASRLGDNEPGVLGSLALVRSTPEYSACPSSRLAELPELPAGARWLNDHYQAILLEEQQALLEQQRQAAERAQQGAADAAAEQQQQQAAGSGTVSRRGTQATPSSGGGEEGEGTGEDPKPARHDKSRTSVRLGSHAAVPPARHMHGFGRKKSA